MSLMEHIRELRDRLFKASIGVLVGFVGGWLLSEHALAVLQDPYCQHMLAIAQKGAGSDFDPAGWKCPFTQIGLTDVFVLKMKIALWIGLIIAAPIWLYQLWAFIAPGLHRHERRWAYAFAGVAAPLFALGSVAAYFVVAKGLAFLLQFTPANTTVQLEITRYVDFVTGFMLLFGMAFEFPLVVVLFNLAGLASAKRLLGWWRIAVFLMFVFAAVATPTPDPFGMTALALALSSLYFGAVGFAFLNDRRRGRAALYADLDDDEVSPMEFDPVDDDLAVGAGESLPAPVAAESVPAPQPLDRRFDDTT
jgi:sec-independent protein translocase protein TatC